jgi:hypothetical protein
MGSSEGHSHRPDRTAVIDGAAVTLRKSIPLGHQAFILIYKHFEPLGPASLPLVARADPRGGKDHHELGTNHL